MSISPTISAELLKEKEEYREKTAWIERAYLAIDELLWGEPEKAARHVRFVEDKGVAHDTPEDTADLKRIDAALNELFGDHRR